MAKKLAHCFYEVSPVESLTFLISGPMDPFVALDDTTLKVNEGKPFKLTPQMLSGSGSHHLMNVVLLFPPGAAAGKGYTIDVTEDSGAVLETVPKKKPDIENSAKVQFMIRVA